LSNRKACQSHHALLSDKDVAHGTTKAATKTGKAVGTAGKDTGKAVKTGADKTADAVQ